jgi:hypothetical protein
MEKDLVTDPLEPVRKKWDLRTVHRAGRLPWYDALVSAIHESRKGGAAPLLVHFEWGDVPGRAPNQNLGQVVLALPETRPVAEIDQQLVALVNGLVGKAGLASATPARSWSAGSLASQPPSPPDSRPLRHRFRHATFELLWEGP